MKVESKYKNPDKMIKTLQAKLEESQEWGREDREALEKERGTHWFAWAKGNDTYVTFSKSTEVRRVCVGQGVIMKGRIMKVERSPEDKDTCVISLEEASLVDED